MNRYPQGWLVGYVEKIPAAGGEHAIIRQRRVETAITVIITTALNNAGDAMSKYPRRMFSRPTKAKRSEVASSKFERAPRAESLPAPKNFFAKTSFTQRLPPLWDRTIFGQVFVRGSMIKFSKWKVPPTGGSSAP